MTMGDTLEDAANALELRGGDGAAVRADELRRVDLERRIELERADAARKALEEAACELEGYAANDLYQRAMRIGARLVRSMKPA